MSAGDDAARRALSEQLDQSFFVEAAAGTGKTRQLVARAVALLAAGRAEVDRLAVITFTEKAAGELQLRLREALDSARDTAPPAERARLEIAIARLEEATIDTIHGFCREILRTRPVEAKLDPEFVVEGDGERLLTRVFPGWFAEQLARPPPGIARFLARNRVSKPDETPVTVLQGAVRSMLDHRDLLAPWPRPEVDLAADRARLGAEVTRIAALLTQGAPDDPLRLELAPLVDAAEWLRDAPGDQEAAADHEARLVDLRKLLRARYKGSTNWGGTGPFADGVRRGEVHAACKGLERELDRFQTLADQHLAAELHQELRPVVERYIALARRTGRLDFQDLLVITRDLVRDHPEARRSLQDRFRHIMVDEFQDTDPLQAEIVLLLAADDPHERRYLEARPRPGKLTLVGDPKQSIYGFRRADLAMYTAVERALVAGGARRVELGRSHRALAPIQALVNEAFRAPFTPNDLDPSSAHQPGYVPLEGGPEPIAGQPAIVALPARMPFDRFWGRVYAPQVQKEAPRSIAGFVAWLVADSGWRVRGEDGGLRPVEASDICLLFKQTSSWGRLVTTEYQAALEAHGIDNVLVGARVLHDRDEVETLITALSALEWPDDELMVYGALKGPLFSFTDAALWSYRERRGRLHPFRAPRGDREAGEEAEIEATLGLLRDLSKGRNRRPFADTAQALLRSCRAHAGLGLRPAGAQILANVERVVDLARAYEQSDGLSFRGFVERLREEADQPKSQEGALNEETAPGVRLMTVHKAKGLEFPVVILADVGTRPRRDAERHTDPEAGLAAFKLAGLVPKPVVDAAALAGPKNEAENLRQAYVAATRARDLLVLPTVGMQADRLIEGSWLAPVLRAIHPRRGDERSALPCPGAPLFGPESVDFGEGESFRTVQPGLHTGRGGGFDVAWWDPTVLPPPPQTRYGLAYESYLTPDVDSPQGIEGHRRWVEEGATIRGDAGMQTILLRDLGAAAPGRLGQFAISERSLPGAGDRPGGRRFGQLVHRAARDLDLGADDASIEAVVRLHARSLDAAASETEAAVEALRLLHRDPLVARARAASVCHQDFAVVHMGDDQTVTDTRFDLLFEEPEGWVGVDLVTGSADPDALRAKMAHALAAIEAGGRSVLAGVLLRL